MTTTTSESTFALALHTFLHLLPALAVLQSRHGVGWSGDALAGNLRWWPPICQAGQRARLDWTGDQITDLTPDAQIAGIKIQFPTAATTTLHGAAAPRARRTKRASARIASLFLFSPAFLSSRCGAAIGRSTVNGGDGGGRIDELLRPLLLCQWDLSLSLFDLIALAAKSNWIVVQIGTRD